MDGQRTIFACGGGGFDSDSPARSYLDKFFLELTGKSNPKVCLVPTASGDSLLRVARFLKACSAFPCRPSTLELYRPPSSDLESFVMDQDAIFVSGGSTRNLLVLWQEWGLDQALKRAWDNGVILGGVSAGANCWFEGCSTDSNFGELTFLPALGWLPGVCVPHFDEEPGRKPHADALIAQELAQELVGIDGGAGVLFRGTSLVGVVGQDGHSAYKITKAGITELNGIS